MGRTAQILVTPAPKHSQIANFDPGYTCSPYSFQRRRCGLFVPFFFVGFVCFVFAFARCATRRLAACALFAGLTEARAKIVAAYELKCGGPLPLALEIFTVTVLLVVAIPSLTVTTIVKV